MLLRATFLRAYMPTRAMLLRAMLLRAESGTAYAESGTAYAESPVLTGHWHQARGAERLREELATVGAQVAGLAVPKGEGGFTEAFVDEYKRQGSGVKDRVEGLQKQVPPAPIVSYRCRIRRPLYCPTAFGYWSGTCWY